jgi:hypothetical protein
MKRGRSWFFRGKCGDNMGQARIFQNGNGVARKEKGTSLINNE